MSVDDVIEFMTNRDVSPSILETLRTEKIDVETVLQVDDQALSLYIPKLGDRVALKTHCTKLYQKLKKKDPRKTELFQVLKMKLVRRGNKKPDDVDDVNDDGLEKVNWRTRSRKETRKIEFGWIHNEHQVRKRYGGGIRKLDVNRSLCKQELLDIAKNLFFPHGKSSKGYITEFSCDLLDFKQNIFPNGMTVADCYDLFKIGIVTFYLHTKSHGTGAVNDNGQPSDEQGSTEPDEVLTEDTNDIQESFTASGTQEQEQNTETLATGDHSIDIPSSQTHDILQEAVYSIASFDEELPDLNDENFPSISFQEDQDAFGIQPEEETAVFSVQMLIHRGSLAFAEILGYFKDADILNKVLMVTRILPNGKYEKAEDTGGVLRDTITEFWEHFYNQFTIGRNVKVPSLRHDFGIEEWKAVGRVLVFGWRRLNYWPLKLSKVFVMQCLFPGSDPDSTTLMEDFYEFATVMDSENFHQAIDDFDSVDEDDLFESLESYNCRSKVDHTNLLPVLLEIANLKLIQETMYVVESWRDILPNLPMTKEQLNLLYSTKKPTNKSVLKLLELPEASNVNERQTGKFLKQYVKEMDDEKLQKFLRFCTGSDMINCDKIEITFIPMEYIQRRPIAHTCGAVLKLSNNYSNYMEFRTEFDSVLSSNIWVMDII